MRNRLQTKRFVTDNAAHQVAVWTAVKMPQAKRGVRTVGKLTQERIAELLRAMDARSLAKRKSKES